MKTFDLRKYLVEGYLFKEEDNFNNEKYPKAEAWLEEHPNIEVFDEVPEQFLQYDMEDSPEDIETAITEAGYMFISELEAALEGRMDDEYLESCAENGVINDPTYNPPVNSWNYLDEDSSLQKEAFDSLGQYHGSQAFSNDDNFTKSIYALMKELDSRMDEYYGREDGDYEFDENDARIFRALKRAYEGLDELVHLELADY